MKISVIPISNKVIDSATTNLYFLPTSIIEENIKFHLGSSPQTTTKPTDSLKSIHGPLGGPWASGEGLLSCIIFPISL